MTSSVSLELIQKQAITDSSSSATWGDVTRILNMNSFLGDFTDFYGHNDPGERWP